LGATYPRIVENSLKILHSLSTIEEVKEVIIRGDVTLRLSKLLDNPDQEKIFQEAILLLEFLLKDGK
jgi:hypothetical protein